MKFVQLVLRRPMSVIMLILGIVVFGSASLSQMPLEYMPDMEMPMELVMVTWPGADADSVDRLLTQPLEEECESLSGLDSINSYSSENYTMLQLTYNYGTDMNDAYSDLKSAIDNLMPSLPDDCQDPMIMEISADALGTMIISATAPEGIDVTDYLEDDVVPALENIGGVARVELSGARDEYLRIVLDEAAMRQYGLSISTVGSAIAAADFDMPVGSVSLGSQDIALGVYGNVEVNPSFRDLPIQTPSGQTVMLEDICTFFNLYKAEADSVSRYNGEESVMLTVTKQDSASTMEVCSAVQNVLDQYSVDGVGFQVTYSEGDSILETLGEILNTLITGVILTMLVLFVFFGDLKASLIVGVSMPLSILLAVILLNFAGFNIDLMTGSALIIAIGMIVDNSIVILESCMRAKEDGLEAREAAAVGTSTMLMSILAGTLTTVVVYIPMAMAEGLVGMMTAPLSWTILLTLTCSFLSAVVVVPLAFIWLKPRTRDELITNRILGRFKAFYRRTLPRLLRHPGRVVSVGAACFVAAILLMSQMEFVLMPSNFDGSITISAAFRSGTKVEVMSQRIQALEDALLADENFESVTLDISGSTASFTAYAVSNCGRSSEEAVVEYTNQFGSMPDMDVSVSPTGTMDMSSMMSSNSKDVVLLSNDLDSLQEAATSVEDAMAQVPGVIRIENPFNSSQSKGRIVIDSQKAMALGTSESAVAMQIYYLLDGLTATSVTYEDTEYDVVLEYPEGKYDDITSLLDYSITTQTGQQVALRDISTVEYITTLPTITRQDGQYSVTLTATTTDTAKYSAPEAIDAQVAGVTLPAGVSVGVGMMDQSTADGLESMTTAILAGAFLVFLVMAIQFDSPRLSIMVMMCIPPEPHRLRGTGVPHRPAHEHRGPDGLPDAHRHCGEQRHLPGGRHRPAAADHAPGRRPGGGGHHPPAPHPDDHPHHHHLHGAHDVLHRQRYGHDEGYGLRHGGRPGGLHHPGHVPDARLLPAHPAGECGRHQTGPQTQAAEDRGWLRPVLTGCSGSFPKLKRARAGHSKPVRARLLFFGGSFAACPF